MTVTLRLEEAGTSRLCGPEVLSVGWEGQTYEFARCFCVFLACEHSLSIGWNQTAFFNSNNSEAVSWSFEIVIQQKTWEKNNLGKGNCYRDITVYVIKYEIFQSWLCYS